MSDLLIKIPANILLLISAVFVITMDYFAKRWSIERTSLLFILVLVMSLLTTIFYMPVLLKNTLIVSSFLWSLFADIGVIFLGLVVFQEALNTYQWIGVFFAIVAIILLNT